MRGGWPSNEEHPRQGNGLPWVFYHATTAERAEAILADGLKPGSYLTANEALADYYAETVEDEGDEAVILVVFGHALTLDSVEPDHPGLEEPITSTLDLSEDEVWPAWEATGQSGLDCINLIGSCRYAESVVTDCIERQDDLIDEPDADGRVWLKVPEFLRGSSAG